MSVSSLMQPGMAFYDRNDAPTIDQMYHGTDVSLYKNQLRTVGVKVEGVDVCSYSLALFLEWKIQMQ